MRTFLETICQLLFIVAIVVTYAWIKDERVGRNPNIILNPKNDVEQGLATIGVIGNVAMVTSVAIVGISLIVYISCAVTYNTKEDIKKEGFNLLHTLGYLVGATFTGIWLGILLLLILFCLWPLVIWVFIFCGTQSFIFWYETTLTSFLKKWILPYIPDMWLMFGALFVFGAPFILYYHESTREERAKKREQRILSEYFRKEYLIPQARKEIIEGTPYLKIE